MTHDFFAGRVGTDRQPAANDLAKRQHVWLDVVQPCSPFEAHPEAADDLVKEQQNALARANATHFTQKLWVLNQQAVVRRDRLDGHHRDLVLVRGNARFQGRQVVQRQHQRFLGVRLRNPR